MLKTAFLTFTAIGLTVSGFIFPQQAPGLFTGATVTGSALFLLDGKDKELAKKARDINSTERKIEANKKSIEDLRIRLEERSAKLAEKEDSVNTLQKELNQKLEELRVLEDFKKVAQFDAQRLKHLEESLNDLKLDLKDKQRDLLQFQSELDSQSAELQSKSEKLARLEEKLSWQEQQLAKDKAELIQAISSFETNKSSYQEAVWGALQEQANNLVQVRVQEAAQPLLSLKEDLENREKALQEVLPKLTEALRQEYEEAVEKIAQDCNKRVGQVVQSGEIFRATLINANKDALLELHELKQPNLPPADIYEDQPKASLVAERTLRYLYDNGLYLDYADSYEEKGGVSLLIKVKKKATKFVECYHSIGKHLPALQSLAPNCESIPQYGILNDGFRIDFDLSGLTSQQRAAKTRIKEVQEPPENWLEEVIRYTYHFRVNGQTRAGKSTFVNNLIGLMKRMFDKPVEVVLIDPKYPMSRWSIKPKYKGLEESIIGLKEMAEEVQRRLKLATEDADNGREIRDFEPILYVLDEADTVAGEYNDPTPPVADYLESLHLSTKKSVAHLLKQGLKVGAALQVGVCYIGQSPLCSTLGMNRNDFNHSANFFLGENIPTAIEEVALKHQQPYLKQQYRLRVERYMQAKGTEEEKKYRYFGLVKCPGEPAFLASLPPEGYYDKEVSFAFVGAGGDGSLDSDDPEDIKRFARTLEASLHKGSDSFEPSMETQPDLGKNELLAWKDNADPAALVESAKLRIVALILEGIEKPSEICKMIWGDVVNTSAKPYNVRKGGVKKRIEFIISEIKKSK
ncbi:MAG TPA: hypothetical protein V6D26_09880 [Stenomitos sp.]